MLALLDDPFAGFGDGLLFVGGERVRLSLGDGESSVNIEPRTACGEIVGDVVANALVGEVMPPTTLGKISDWS